MDIYQYSFVDLHGQCIQLADYKQRVLLLFNSASECGFTPQLTEFERLHQHYAHQGLSIFGFPCNQFKNQEPGDSQHIATFCHGRLGVTFPLAEKIQVNGAHTHPLWRYLKHAQPGLLGTEYIKWNFTKFLVAKDGSVLKRFAPQTRPTQFICAIEAALHA